MALNVFNMSKGISKILQFCLILQPRNISAESVDLHINYKRGVKIPKGVIFKRLAIVLSVHRFTSTDYHFVIFKRLVIVMSVHRFTSTDYHFVIFKRLAIVLSVPTIREV
jgi:hypothetical protein